MLEVTKEVLKLKFSKKSLLIFSFKKSISKFEVPLPRKLKKNTMYWFDLLVIGLGT